MAVPITVGAALTVGQARVVFDRQYLDGTRRPDEP